MGNCKIKKDYKKNRSKIQQLTINLFNYYLIIYNKGLAACPLHN